MELIPIIYIVLEVTVILTILTIVISKIVNKKEPEKSTVKDVSNTNGKELLNKLPDYKINSTPAKIINNNSLQNSKQNPQQNKKVIKAEVKYNLNSEKNYRAKRIEILNNNTKANLKNEKNQNQKHDEEKSKKLFNDKNNYDILSKYSDEDINLYTPDTKKKANNRNEI